MSDLEKVLGYAVKSWKEFWNTVDMIRHGETLRKRYDDEGNTVRNFEEVADELGCNSQTVRSRITRVLSTLRIEAIGSGWMGKKLK